MSSNIYEDPNLTANVRYSKGVRRDGGEKVERVVDIYESAGTVRDDHVDYSPQDGGAHTQKCLSIVQINSFRAAALILGLLLVVAVMVLSKLYISARFEKQTLSNRFKELQAAHEELKNSLNYSPCGTQSNAEEWKRFRCSCYHKSTEMKNWTESRKDCQDRGADLVTVNNKEEQEFIWKLGTNEDSWVGLQSVRRNEWTPTIEWKWKWKWVDASRPGYLGWSTRETLKPLEGSTGYIDVQGNLQHTNTGSKQWICEIPM